MLSSMAAKRRMLFERAASRAADQLATTGDVSPRTRARLLQGWQDGSGHHFGIDPTIVDSSGIDTLRALGTRGPTDYQETRNAALGLAASAINRRNRSFPR